MALSLPLRSDRVDTRFIWAVLGCSEYNVWVCLKCNVYWYKSVNFFFTVIICQHNTSCAVIVGSGINNYSGQCLKVLSIVINHLDVRIVEHRHYHYACFNCTYVIHLHKSLDVVEREPSRRSCKFTLAPFAWNFEQNDQISFLEEQLCLFCGPERVQGLEMMISKLQELNRIVWKWVPLLS